MRVSRVRFNGVHAVKESQLRSVLATVQSSRLRWGAKHYFQRTQFDADLKRIVAFYRDRGFPDAKVTSFDVKLNDRQDAVDVALNIDEGRPILVEQIDYTGFDVVPPRQYLGANAYRKDWVDFFAMFKGPPKIDITDLSIAAEGNLGFSHSVQRVRGTDTKGQPVDLTVRVTDGYRKIGGNWLIVLEHVSVPVDLATGKPDLSSKP